MTRLPGLYTDLAPRPAVRRGFVCDANDHVLRLEARKVPFVHCEVEPGTCDTFVGSKPAGQGR